MLLYSSSVMFKYSNILSKASSKLLNGPKSSSVSSATQ
nr:MAG TPA: hypothetical protein [Caudoviricetes sp.]